MSRPVIIYYDNVDVFDNVPCPTPFVTRSNSVINYGVKHGQLSSLTLNGIITGTGFADVYQNTQNLISGFSKNFKELKIVDYSDGTETIFQNIVKVNDISFDQSTFAASTNFTINLEAYESELFSGQFGIIDPEDSIDVTRSENGDISITRTISARGFNTNLSTVKSNAFENARNFVTAKTGLAAMSTFAIPYFASGTGNGNNLILTSQSESINRFEATYGITEEYVYQELSGADSDLYGNLTYPIHKSCTFNYSPSSQESPKEEAGFNIKFKTNKEDGAFEYLRSQVTKYVNKIKTNSLSSLQDKMVEEAYANFNLEKGYAYYELSENEQEGSIDLTLNISKDPTFDTAYGIYFTESYSLNNDPLRDFTSVNYSFNVTPFGLVSSQTTSYNNVSNTNKLQERAYAYYKDQILGGSYGTNSLSGHILTKSKFAFTGIFGQNSDLEDKFRVTSIEKNDNPDNGEISVSSSSTNNEGFASGTLVNGSYDVSVVVPQKILKVSSSALTQGHYLVTELDTTYSRQESSVNLNASVDAKTKSSLATSAISTSPREAKSFCDGIINKINSGADKKQILRESSSLDKYDGSVSASKSESCKHNNYKISAPYLGRIVT
jgi:hypothetical protein